MRPANKRRRYNVTLSLIGFSHTQNDICLISSLLSVKTYIASLKIIYIIIIIYVYGVNYMHYVMLHNSWM